MNCHRFSGHNLQIDLHSLKSGESESISLTSARKGYSVLLIDELQCSAISGAFHKSNHQTKNLAYLLRYLADHQGSPGSVTKLARDWNEYTRF